MWELLWIDYIIHSGFIKCLDKIEIILCIIQYKLQHPQSSKMHLQYYLVLMLAQVDDNLLKGNTAVSMPLELLWDQVKLRIANYAWKTLSDIESAISEVLQPFWQHVKNVWSLLGNTWLTRGVIIFLQRRLE